ncbi:hypothetical protein M569_01825 [Genlisea aurea]|uniref:Uncharacterized protein n=1 Tax=Genlisea aurea TaxID=192259 RepID=S8D6A9_9LAMI|nr:hypothetical protein M569_01825 [Genlisea aurea]
MLSDAIKKLNTASEEALIQFEQLLQSFEEQHILLTKRANLWVQALRQSEVADAVTTLLDENVMELVVPRATSPLEDLEAWALWILYVIIMSCFFVFMLECVLRRLQDGSDYETTTNEEENSASSSASVMLLSNSDSESSGKEAIPIKVGVGYHCLIDVNKAAIHPST